jgi:hypothetical protein
MFADLLLERGQYAPFPVKRIRSIGHCRQLHTLADRNLKDSLTHRNETMVDEKAVLSFNPDGKALLNHEPALRDAGLCGYLCFHSDTGSLRDRNGPMRHLSPQPYSSSRYLPRSGESFQALLPVGIVIFLTKDSQAGLPDADVFCLEGMIPTLLCRKSLRCAVLYDRRQADLMETCLKRTAVDTKFYMYILGVNSPP